MFCSACGSRLPELPPVTCPRCDTKQWLDPKPCAGALVTHAAKLLLVRRSHEPWLGCWDVPGGFCDGNEHPISTAEREVLEETGLKVRVTGMLGMWLDTYGDELEQGQQKITLNIYYHAVPTEEVFVNPDPAEVAEVGWFGADTLPKELAFPGHIAPVLRAWWQAFIAGQIESPLPDRPKQHPSSLSP